MGQHGISPDGRGQSKSFRRKQGKRIGTGTKAQLMLCDKTSTLLQAGDYKEVLILSGDHIYCMDYAPLVRFHRDRKAQVTIGMLYVPWEETQHFGVGIVDERDRVIDWQEKPQEARSNLASMGIYVFNREYLVRTLQETKEEDFGQHVIPRALKAGRVYGYPFHGYWRDAGTIQAYWDANMDLLDPQSELNPT